MSYKAGTGSAEFIALHLTFRQADCGRYVNPITIRGLNYAHHGLRTPNEAFFHQNTKLLGLGRQFGQIDSCLILTKKILLS